MPTTTVAAGRPLLITARACSQDCARRTAALTRCPSDGLEHIVMARSPCGPHVRSVNSSQAPRMDSAGIPLNKRQKNPVLHPCLILCPLIGTVFLGTVPVVITLTKGEQRDDEDKVGPSPGIGEWWTIQEGIVLSHPRSIFSRLVADRLMRSFLGRL